MRQSINTPVYDVIPTAPGSLIRSWALCGIFIYVLLVSHMGFLWVLWSSPISWKHSGGVVTLKLSLGVRVRVCVCESACMVPCNGSGCIPISRPVFPIGIGIGLWIQRYHEKVTEVEWMMLWPLHDDTYTMLWGLQNTLWFFLDYTSLTINLLEGFYLHLQTKTLLQP